METPRKPGRPRKTTKNINPVRQVGRWPDADWDRVRAAAAAEGLSVAAFVRRIVLAALRRR